MAALSLSVHIIFILVFISGHRFPTIKVFNLYGKKQSLNQNGLHCFIKFYMSKAPRPIGLWSKRGLKCVFLRCSVDLTIYMDIESNPGPTPYYVSHSQGSSLNYSSSYRNFGSMTALDNNINRSPATNSCYCIYSEAPLLYYNYANQQHRPIFNQDSVIFPCRKQFRGNRAGRKVREKCEITP